MITITQDPISITRINSLHPLLRVEALKFYNAVLNTANITIRIVQAYRTFAEQKALYDQGRTTPGKIVTNSKPGSSFHNYGLALDFCLLHGDKTISWDRNEDMDHDKISDWVETVRIFKDGGWFWGGDFKSIFDAPHLEKTFGLSISDCRNKLNNNEIDENGYLLIS